MLAAAIGLSCRTFLRLYLEGDGFSTLDKIEISVATSLFIGAVAIAFTHAGAAAGLLINVMGVVFAKIASLISLPRYLELAAAIVCLILTLMMLQSSS